MELSACSRALEWVAKQCRTFSVQRVQLFTDSLYVYENHKRPHTWRKQKWRNHLGRPIDNSDLWKRYISVSSRASVRVDVLWAKGKKSPILKMVDRAAKAAGKSPSHIDRGSEAAKLGDRRYKSDRPPCLTRQDRWRRFMSTGRRPFARNIIEFSSTYSIRHVESSLASAAHMLLRR
ncbi:MAG: ribonuclease [Acidobacteriaceae bacterium]|jgi:ribonuclease HI|nr:ribonuclease [Acidobacteriaceae bacterium]MDX6463882.1 ribonuclease [Acidobacteriaceae bacterium]MEA2258445.1 ribonuclease [Acidobacteriaceae bacterium]